LPSAIGHLQGVPGIGVAARVSGRVGRGGVGKASGEAAQKGPQVVGSEAVFEGFQTQTGRRRASQGRGTRRSLPPGTHARFLSAEPVRLEIPGGETAPCAVPPQNIRAGAAESRPIHVISRAEGGTPILVSAASMRGAGQTGAGARSHGNDWFRYSGARTRCPENYGEFATSRGICRGGLSNSGWEGHS